MLLRCGGVPEHFNYPWHVAIENDYFKEEGLEIEWIDYKGGTGAMCTDLRNGTLDMATLLTEGAVADIAKGNPSVIHSVYVQSPLIWGIHTGHTSSHTNPDAPGKIRYAISRFGSGSHLMALVDRLQRGLSLADAEWVVIQNLDGARHSLIHHESDYFLWEKNMTAPYVYAKELRRIGECPTPWPSVVLSVSKQTLQKYDNLAGLNRALRKAITFIQELSDPAKTIADVYGLKEEDARDWYSRIQWNPGIPLSVTDYETTANALLKADILSEIPDYSSICMV